jgi:hypothetical protein
MKNDQKLTINNTSMFNLIHLSICMNNSTICTNFKFFNTFLKEFMMKSLVYKEVFLGILQYKIDNG